MLGFQYQLLSAAAAGFLSHWCYFIHGEHDLQAANIARAHIVLCIVVASAKGYVEGFAFSNVFRETTVLGATYVGVMMTSIAVYRLFFSPLRRFPGAFSWKLSKLTHVWSMTKPDNFKVLERKRQKYGDVVRTGPNEVTLFTVEAFHQVYNSNSTCTKSPYYDLLQPMESLDTTRDPAVHSRRRKIWDQFFTLEKQEGLVYEYGEKLVTAIGKRVNEPLDVSDWFEYYTFDLMGKFGMGFDFGLLEGQPHDIHHLYHLAHQNLGPIGAAPWMKHLMMSIPYIERLRSYRLFLNWTTNLLQNKIESKSEIKDVLGYVVEDARRNGGFRAEWRFMMGDLALLIAAGSDPMRLALTNIFYYLIACPEHLRRLRDELAKIDWRDYTSLARLDHLSAVIYETLRLNPPVPAAGLRITPPEGLTLSNTHVPGGTTVLVPHYSLFRDSRSFHEPNDFVPERFTTRPELIRDQDAYVPWSAGKGQCIGKRLSLLEIRVAVAAIVTRFDVAFAPGEDGRRMFAETIDYFTSTPGPLRLVFREREA